MRQRGIFTLMAAALVADLARVRGEEASPGEGKKKRAPKPTQEFEQGPMTRQQRRYAERQARNQTKGAAFNLEKRG